MPRSRRCGLSTLAALLAIAAVLAHQLLVPPIVGLADNGDYSRLWNQFGIHSTLPEGNTRYFDHVVRDWLVDPAKAWDTGFASPDVELVKVAMHVNPLFAPPGHFDIRSLAVVRIVLFLGAAALLMQAACRAGRWPTVLAFAALALVFADVGYVSYFNSGYSEPSSFLSALYVVALFAALVARVPPSPLHLAGFFAAAIVLTASKPQNILVALPLALFSLRLVALRDARVWKAGVVAGAIAVVAAAVHVRTTPLPAWYQQQVRHIAVFNAILPSSPDPAADLQALGLPASLATLSGRYPWHPDAAKRQAELEATFHPLIDEATIALFLLQRPSRVRHLLGLAAPQALWLRPGLGNFTADSGHPPGARSTAHAWRSDAVKRYGPQSLRSLALVAGLAALLAVGHRRRARTPQGRLAAEAVLCLLACAALQYATVATLQGPMNEEKGMMLFAFFFDAAIIAAAGLGLAMLVPPRTDSGIRSPIAPRA